MHLVAQMESSLFVSLAAVNVGPYEVDVEADLVRQARRDLRRFSDLYEMHVQRVYRYLLVRCGSAADAQDLTSQTFLAAMENLTRFRGDRPFAAWLMGIARHKVIDFYRSRRPVDDLDSGIDVADDDPPVEIAVGRKLDIEVIASKLQALAPDRAEALALRLFGGLEVAEIAKTMERNEPAVRMLIHRGMRDLQSQLNPYWEISE